ncbi:MAG: hypothetical protein KC487_14380, partial [Anaerolineae bacterium]|nr:hypothetical protein [Anaerolineae bacterium]
MSNSKPQPTHRHRTGRDRALLGLLAVIALLAGITFARNDDRVRADLLYQVSPATDTPDPNSPVSTPTFTPTSLPTNTPTEPLPSDTPVTPVATDTVPPIATDTTTPIDTPIPQETATPQPTDTP